MTGKRRRAGPQELPDSPQQSVAATANDPVLAGEGQSPQEEKSSYHAATSARPYGPKGVTPEELRALPVVFPFDPVVPWVFGISRSTAYRALAAGEFPFRPLRLGRKLIVKRADLLASLGVNDRSATTDTEGQME
jgi:hypothetical protein